MKNRVNDLLLKRKFEGEKHLKSKTLVILLSAMILLSMATPIEAFIYPGNPPTEDAKYNNFGPMTPNLLIIPYGSQEAEYMAFLACDIDFMDCSLLAAQVMELETFDPTMSTYARAFFVDRGMREFDLNNMRFPCSDPQFRKALAYCFDKNTFIATQLLGFALKMDSPLAGHGGYYNPYCTDLYPFNLATAQAILDANGYTDKDSDTWREGPAGEEIVLDFYIRSGDPDRTVMGLIMAATLESIGLECNEQIVPRSTCFQMVMVQFNYDLYTGGWSFGRDPDTMISLYHSNYAQAFDGTPNYPGYTSAAFDAEADLMLTSSVTGIPYVYPPGPAAGTAAAHVWEMQRILMDDAGVIPVFTYASYGSYKTGWSKVVNTNGVGPWGYYTFLDTYKTGDDTINWGFMNDIEGINPIHSQGVWDWQLMGEIYDSLINVDPYTLADQPWMAKSWSQGEWEYEGNPCTWVEFKLREDVYWHDIPAKADRQTPGGAPLLRAGAFNERVMADDVVFSIMVVKNTADAWNHGSVENVLCAEEVDPYTVKVYFDVLMPLWAMHQAASLPIIPKHVWSPVYAEGTTREFDAIAQECAAGSGPFYYDYDASIVHEYYMLRAFTRHFAYHPVDVTSTISNSRKIVDPGNDVTVSFYLHNRDAQRDPIPPSEFTITIEMIHETVDPVIYVGSNPALPYCEEVLIFEYTFHVDVGLYEFKTTITPDPLTGHGDSDGYSTYVWGTIREDLNLDFAVNSKDAAVLNAAYNTRRGDPRWNPYADINDDGFVGPKDAVKLGTMLGWPKSPGTLHDVAVTNVETSKHGCLPMETVGEGQSLQINVTVENQGSSTETFDVTVYATSAVPPSIEIGTQTVTNLLVSEVRVVTFTWDTTGVSYGNYSISAVATLLLDIDPVDNTFVDGTILITIAGDINGDQWVNGKDGVILGTAFYPAGTYNPNADINDDEYVNAKDAVILGGNFGQHWE